jgi:hypothetical protein
MVGGVGGAGGCGVASSGAAGMGMGMGTGMGMGEEGCYHEDDDLDDDDDDAEEALIPPHMAPPFDEVVDEIVTHGKVSPPVCDTAARVPLTVSPRAASSLS